MLARVRWYRRAAKLRNDVRALVGKTPLGFEYLRAPWGDLRANRPTKI